MKLNKSGTIEAIVTGITAYRNRNRYYICDLIEISSGEILEEGKLIQISNYNSGKFGNKIKYLDRELHKKARKAWDNLLRRAKKRYFCDVEFADFKDFYGFIEHFLDINNLRDKFLFEGLVVDKDLRSKMLKLDKKSYSRDTILLISQADNLEASLIMNERGKYKGICEAEKEDLIYKLLQKYNYNR